MLDEDDALQRVLWKEERRLGDPTKEEDDDAYRGWTKKDWEAERADVAYHEKREKETSEKERR